MAKELIVNIRERAAGIMAGSRPLLRRLFQAIREGFVPSRPLSGVTGSLRTAAAGAAAALSILTAAALPASAALVHGDRIINAATLTTASAPPAHSSVTTTVVVRTPSVIEFLTYSPGAATSEYISSTAYRTGSDPLAPFAPLPAPVDIRTDPDSTIAINQTVPLVSATTYHQGEPVFVRVTDRDQNVDPAVRETILITLTDSVTGDTELLRLTETGTNTGIFAGYIQSGSGTASASYNGTLAVSQGSTIQARYVDVVDGSDTSVDSVMVDPYGIVFDTVTGLPVSGATVRLLTADGSIPTGLVFADDGVTPFPYELVTGAEGTFRYPFILPGSYILQVTPPESYSRTALTIDTLTQRWGDTFTIVDPASIGGSFPVNPGPAIRIDIPLDPRPTALWIQKVAGKSAAAIGDFVPYAILLQNRDSAAAATGVSVRDVLPVGFRYQKGSARVDGSPAADPSISADGRTLTFQGLTVPAQGSIPIAYVAEVGAGVRTGTAVNRATALLSGIAVSNTAEASIDIFNDFLVERTIIMGQIFSGACGAPAPLGSELAGIRIYLEDGTFVDTDPRGMYHFDGVRPGTHVVQLDLDSLPPGFQAVPCEQNSRFAGRSYSQFVDLQGGSIWRADFHIARTALASGAESLGGDGSPAAPSATLELSSAIENGDVVYRVLLSGSAPLQDTTLTVQLPAGTAYRPGSSLLDGATLADPEVRDASLVYRLPAGSGAWRSQLSFTAAATEASDGDLTTRAILSFTAGGIPYATPLAENIFRRTVAEEVNPLPDFILHPLFPTLGIQLSEADRMELAALAQTLKLLRVREITVTGHTDNVPIAPHNRHIYANNNALSWARARSVGRYLMEALGLPPAGLTLAGLGQTMPVADNGTEAGRSRNRRVEIRVRTDQVVQVARTSMVKEQSGPQAVTPPPPLTPPPTEPEAPAPVEEKKPGITEKEGILSPAAETILANRINTVRVCLPANLKPRLMLDGTEIPSNRIGFTLKDPAAGKTLYSYIGVDFGEPGTHTLRLQGLDPFGNARFDTTAAIVKSGEITAIRLKQGPDNIADGKTPVRLVLELLDSEGNVVPATAELEIREGNLKPPRKEGILEAGTVAAGSYERVTVEADGTVLFQPVAASGQYRVLLGHNSATVEAETYAKPLLRDWILVGLAEGTAGYNTVSGHMESLKASGTEEDYYDNGRVAFFAKGVVKGEWLLTAAYDSDKPNSTTGNGLFQTVDPESTYTLYGDATQQQYDAGSSRKLYVKLEREQFYALFGDYDTGLTLTELTRYSRRMNGVKAEFQSRNVEVNVFGSETDQAFARDELRGDGTSGLYRLSRRNIVINSEKLLLEVRDRLHSEVIISSRTLSRFADYTIDYDAGTIFFKEPIPSRDEFFNPVHVVVEYETITSGDAITYGGRAGVKLMDQRVRAGVTYIHEGQVSGDGKSYGVDATVRLGNHTTVKVEAARTETDLGSDQREGTAWLAEVLYRTATIDSRAYYRETDQEFGLGQQTASEAGTRKVGAEAAYKVSNRVTVGGQLSRQYNLENDAERDLAEIKTTYGKDLYGGYLGLRHAEDRLDDGSTQTSDQLTAGARWLTPNRRLTLRVDHDQSIGNDNNVDFPTRTTLGADLKLTERVSTFAQQEFTYGDASRTDSTRVGLKSTPWEGGAIASSVERESSENGDRMFALFGLKQTWRLTNHWSLDGSIDRSQTIRRTYRFDAAVPPASGEMEDFTALSAGTAYREKTWEATGRIEARDGEIEDKWGVMAAALGERSPGWGWSARLQLYDTDAGDLEKTTGELRLGLAYRPRLSRLILLDRLDIIGERQRGLFLELDNWRIVNNLAANYKQSSRLQMSLFYGAKYVQETINGDDYSGFTDMVGIEERYDFTKKWDGSVRFSLLHSWNSSLLEAQAGFSLGYNIMDNAWVSVGYNFVGFQDDDFSDADYTAQGPFVKFRFKFDQNSVREAVRHFTKAP